MTEILLNGVELPNGKDVINLTIDSDGCIIYYDGYGMIEQYVEVIQPHGRLIDADKLAEAFKAFATGSEVGYLRLIDEAPTVLEASE